MSKEHKNNFQNNKDHNQNNSKNSNNIINVQYNNKLINKRKHIEIETKTDKEIEHIKLTKKIKESLDNSIQINDELCDLFPIGTANKTDMKYNNDINNKILSDKNNDLNDLKYNDDVFPSTKSNLTKRSPIKNQVNNNIQSIEKSPIEISNKNNEINDQNHKKIDLKNELEIVKKSDDNNNDKLIDNKQSDKNKKENDLKNKSNENQFKIKRKTVNIRSKSLENEQKREDKGNLSKVKRKHNDVESFKVHKLNYIEKNMTILPKDTKLIKGEDLSDYLQNKINTIVDPIIQSNKKIMKAIEALHSKEKNINQLSDLYEDDEIKFDIKNDKLNIAQTDNNNNIINDKRGKKRGNKGKHVHFNNLDDDKDLNKIDPTISNKRIKNESESDSINNDESDRDNEFKINNNQLKKQKDNDSNDNNDQNEIKEQSDDKEENEEEEDDVYRCVLTISRKSLEIFKSISREQSITNVKKLDIDVKKNPQRAKYPIFAYQVNDYIADVYFKRHKFELYLKFLKDNTNPYNRNIDNIEDIIDYIIRYDRENPLGKTRTIYGFKFYEYYDFDELRQWFKNSFQNRKGLEIALLFKSNNINPDRYYIILYIKFKNGTALKKDLFEGYKVSRIDYLYLTDYEMAEIIYEKDMIIDYYDPKKLITGSYFKQGNALKLKDD